MSGQGAAPQGGDPAGGFVANFLAPAAKIVGLGIAAGGGALGPMLASMGDHITNARDERLKRDVLANTLPDLLAGMQRSRQIAPGTPGKPAVPGTPATEERPSELAPRPEIYTLDEATDVPDAETIIAGSRSTPGTPDIPAVPGTPPKMATWTSGPTMGEAIARLQQRGGPDSTRSLALQYLMKAGLPSMEEEPAGVTRDIQREQHLQDVTGTRDWQVATEGRQQASTIAGEERHTQRSRGEQEREVQAQMAAGIPEAQARANVVGRVPLQPETTVVYTPDGRKQTKDARTGRTLTDEPIRTPEDAEIRRRTFQELIPRAELDMNQAVRMGELAPHEVTAARARLEHAKVTGDLGPYQKFLEAIATERGKERQAEIRARRIAAGVQPSESVMTREETIPTRPIWHKDEFKAITDRLPDVVSSLPKTPTPTGPRKLPSGRTISVEDQAAADKKAEKQAIEQRFKEQHGVDVTVQWVPARSSGNPLTGFGYAPWAGGGEWKIVRAREPERKKSSVTERKKGPPNTIVVPVPSE